MRSIGIPVIIDNDSWIGGLNYYLSLAAAINRISSCSFKFYMLTNSPEKLMSAAGANVEIVYCRFLSSKTLFFRALNFVINSNLILELYAKYYKIDYISHYHSSFIYKGKSLFWMPDFQHKALTSLFSKKDVLIRDRKVVSAARSGAMLLSSYSSMLDFDTYYSSYSNCKKYILNFVPLVNYDYNRVESTLEYFKDKETHIFFLPNQFWRHKNHSVVVDALNMLPENYIVLCSGAVHDYRSSSHIDELLAKIKDFKLEQRFILLGLLERSEMCALMRKSLAIINPSFFEGWSTTVEEAKAYGKRVILSDLAVHREQDPDGALFFDPKVASELAMRMKQIVNEYNVDDEISREDNARINYDSRVNCFAKQYVELLEDFIANN